MIVKENTLGNSCELDIENNSLHEMGILPRNELVEEIKLMLEFLKCQS